MQTLLNYSLHSNSCIMFERNLAYFSSELIQGRQ